MRHNILILVGLVISATACAQFVAKMEVKEPIPGLCSKNDVYALLPGFKGQIAAVCPLTDAQIAERLNNEVAFLKEHPDYSDKGMIGLIINCKGDMVQCKMDNKTKTPELDKQIEAVFNSLLTWKAGKLNNKEVDTSVLYSFTVERGVIVMN